MMEDLYKLLRCPTNASVSELRKSFQELALKYHPDKTAGQATTDEFIKINRAWKILGDSEMREQYDHKWKERCLYQAFPIQDIVEFADFEELVTEEETDMEEINACLSDQPTGGQWASEHVGVDRVNKHMDSEDLDSMASDEGSCYGSKSNTSVSKSEVGKGTESGVRASADGDNAGVFIDHSGSDRVFVYGCRCGGGYQLTGVEVKLRFDIVCCDSCSLTVKVVYDGEEDDL